MWNNSSPSLDSASYSDDKDKQHDDMPTLVNCDSESESDDAYLDEEGPVIATPRRVPHNTGHSGTVKSCTTTPAEIIDLTGVIQAPSPDITKVPDHTA